MKEKRCPERMYNVFSWYNLFMKIYCEHCHHDISTLCDTHFEQNEIGRIQCPHCRKKQKRYISEADLLTYFTFSELLYIILVLVTTAFFRLFGLSVITLIAIIIMFTLAYLGAKQLSRTIYSTGGWKKETMYTSLDEDAESIKKSMKWQFILFFALAITYATGTEFSLFFIAMMIVSVGLSAIKMRLAIKRETSQN